jgi:bifunctional non-homologous end joining protein LigD
MLLGYYQGEHLRFAGKVGTGKGFTAAFTSALRARLDPLVQKACPFTPRPPGWLGKHAHWVRPELVAEIQFSEWTEGGHARHPSFLGFREDKQAKDVVREVPRASDAQTTQARANATGKRRGSKRTASVAGVTITSPERVMYPQLGVTKLDVANVYAAIGRWALPHVAGRPLTLVRCEHGASAADALRSECRFLPHSEGWHRWVPASVRRARIPEQKKVGEYLVIDSLPSLLSIVNGDILELHAWNSLADDVERPDRLVFDLDPGPDVRWSQLVGAAVSVRDRLASQGLQSWVKTTGGKGLHVVVPLQPAADWDACFAFSRAFSDFMARQEPLFTVSFTRAGREGQVLIDYKRNNRTSVSIATFSTRARPDGAMSVPLAWEDLDPRRRPSAYTVQNIVRRLSGWREDPWREYWRCEQGLDLGRKRARVSRTAARTPVGD